jgi:hypothetical protein
MARERERRREEARGGESRHGRWRGLSLSRGRERSVETRLLSPPLASSLLLLHFLRVC